MAKQLDVYRDWLGITETARPLDHYQLLRLTKFEDDHARVRSNYRKMNAHVRKFASGEFAEQSQALLNELAKAMLCLTDAQRKGEYDASLGREQTGDRRRRTFEEILVGRKVLEPAQLDKARNFAKAVNVEMRDAVMQQKLAAPELVMQCYAESLGLPYIELADVGISEELAPKVPAVLARQNSCAPVMVDGGTLLMASPNPLVPEVEDELRLRLGHPVRTVLCTPTGINDVVAKYYPKEAAAAQMAAAGAAPNAAKATTPAATNAAPAAPVDRAAQKKQRMLVAIMMGNFAFVLCVVAGQAMGSLLGFKGVMMFVLAGVAAAIAAAIGWFVGGR